MYVWVFPTCSCTPVSSGVLSEHDNKEFLLKVIFFLLLSRPCMAWPLLVVMLLSTVDIWKEMCQETRHLLVITMPGKQKCWKFLWLTMIVENLVPEVNCSKILLFSLSSVSSKYWFCQGHTIVCNRGKPLYSHHSSLSPGVWIENKKSINTK